MAYVSSNGQVVAKKGIVQQIQGFIWGMINFVGLFFSTVNPATREQRRQAAIERRAATMAPPPPRTFGGGSGGGSGGGGGGLRQRGANIHGLRPASSAPSVPGGGCCGSTCG